MSRSALVKSTCTDPPESADYTLHRSTASTGKGKQNQREVDPVSFFLRKRERVEQVSAKECVIIGGQQSQAWKTKGHSCER